MAYRPAKGASGSTPRELRGVAREKEGKVEFRKVISNVSYEFDQCDSIKCIYTPRASGSTPRELRGVAREKEGKVEFRKVISNVSYEFDQCDSIKCIYTPRGAYKNAASFKRLHFTRVWSVRTEAYRPYYRYRTLR